MKKKLYKNEEVLLRKKYLICAWKLSLNKVTTHLKFLYRIFSPAKSPPPQRNFFFAGKLQRKKGNFPFKIFLKKFWPAKNPPPPKEYYLRLEIITQ